MKDPLLSHMRGNINIMKKLLSLPPNLVECFHDVAGVSHEEYFCTNDPVGAKLGSGGGTNWLLRAAYEKTLSDSPLKGESTSSMSFEEWLGSEKRILLHAGGQSRRLPSYAPSGKVLTPIPVFRWERGQRIGQNLLDLQIPLYERIMEAAPKGLNTLIASGDVYIRAGKLQPIPDADVVCYGLWVDPQLAKNHGVFFSKRNNPGVLEFVLQKPTTDRLAQLMQTHLFLMDIGIWILSDKAIKLLIEKSTNQPLSPSLSPKGERVTAKDITNYDLYSDFGQALGVNPTKVDDEISKLRVAILPLEGGEFYHYGTSREMISSTVAIQNLVYDQRAIMHLGVKAHPSIFTQNSHCDIRFTPENENTWIENSWIGKGWELSHNNIVTGVPQNDWSVRLEPGICIDIVPIGESQWVLRPYGFNDAMRGDLHDPKTIFMGRPVTEWLNNHGLSADDIEGNNDLQAARIFPVCDSVDELGKSLEWWLQPTSASQLKSDRISANEISDRANLRRLHAQRLMFRKENLTQLSKNHRASIFYQTNLDDLAHEFHKLEVPMPEALPETEPLLKRINDSMFRSRLQEYNGEDGTKNAQKAFSLLREGLTQQVLSHRQLPHLDVYSDQIVWGRSPVRIDLAGGWTDTPPYCLYNGGNVVNIAIELNGQPPLQAYVKPCKEFKIVLRSIDLGAREEIATWDELRDFAKVGSPFSIPKAALALAGFLPEFCEQTYASLEDQLKEFGCGIEVTSLSAIPAGSGLGTSSILASTVLGAVSDFCGLAWDKVEICNRTLVLEQLLTTGGGWQDQYGGVLHGVKMFTTGMGFDQTPEVRWLSEGLFTDPQYKPCHLLYYTGITRTAKKILAEIVRGMFLYDTDRMRLLASMKEHSWDMYRAIMHGDFQEMAGLVGKTWRQNQLLDNGTNPSEVQKIVSEIEDLTLGLKLPGAGGGGYLYMIAKDTEAAVRIRQKLEDKRPNERARFVDMSLSKTGLQVSRS